LSPNSTTTTTGHGQRRTLALQILRRDPKPASLQGEV
jgi:hypothetical protein